MFHSYLIGVVAALAARATAQSSTETQSSGTSSTGTASPTSSTGPAIIPVAVGAEGHKFSPNSVTAKVGDIVRFSFYPGGHTVIRAEYKYACIPYEYTGVNKVGFFSGQISPQVISNNLPTFDVLVNDTNSIFYYCSAPGSCTENGMIGVINPSANETLAVQAQFAANASYQLAPGEPFPSETASPSPTNSSAPAPGGASSGLSAGAIAGIAIGATAVVVIAAALLYLCGRRGGQFPMQMVEANYGNGGATLNTSHLVNLPKSPGANTFASYSVTGSSQDHDTYRSMGNSPHTQYFPTPSPQPVQVPVGGYGAYQHQHQPGSGVHTPLMGELQGLQQQQQPYHHGSAPPHESFHHTSPVELPAVAADHYRGSYEPTSPPPQYQPQTTSPDTTRQSWVSGQERLYRPGSYTVFSHRKNSGVSAAVVCYRRRGWYFQSAWLEQSGHADWK
ncbi:hypothetical protein B0T17DRAFT_509477 [Bombardia bombarda]|uniref:Extracellular serine-rich protein n=1 Tax=Bombardia bombarda TaxID=252184 RepID=A0AA39WM22_9PEZI|nr:hypothetical protein B0T17DRAFT_509477 [Bombardia bombarda]